MAETLKFGPEWLRALSDGNSVTSPPPSPGFPKYKLAEHRYGREEMLALYVPYQHACIPDDICAIPVILLEKPQEPMAYIPLTEDEQRMMSQSVNSPAVLRMMGRGSSSGPGGPGATRGGGRGTVGERGRGRGRGRGDAYGRAGSSDDPVEPGFGRGRTYTRSESWEEGRGEKRYDRSYSARTAESENGPTSPRREYARSMSDNWRAAKDEKRGSDGGGGGGGGNGTSTGTGGGGGGGGPMEEDEGGDWRRAGSKSHDKWGNRNWRDRSSRDDRFHPVREERSYQRQRSSGSYDDDNDPDGLPEWSMADVDDMDTLGTFDASGAFMSMKDALAMKAEEEWGERERRRKESKESVGSEERYPTNSTNGANEKTDTDGIPDDKPSSDNSAAKTSEKPDAKDTANSVQAKQRPDKAKEKLKSKQKRENVNSASIESAPVKPDSETVQKIEPEPSPEPVVQSVQNGLNEPPPLPASNAEKFENAEPVPVQMVQPEPRQLAPKKHEDETSFDHLEKAAEEMMANWTAEEDAKSDGKAKVERGSLPWDHEDSKKWFYRDPQGDLQGPFSSSEMAEWFSAGYFTMNLLVKRGCDDRFQPLGEIIKRWGRVPFLAGPSPPPLVHTPVSRQSPGPVATTASDQPALAPPPQQQQPQQHGPNVLDSQMKMFQQQFMLQQQLFQQQLYIRQLQLLQQVQQTERFAKLPAQQQQQLVVQLLMKQQEQMMAHQPVPQPPGQLPQQPAQKVSPRSTPDQTNLPNFQNAPPELIAMVNQNWPGANQPNAGAWMQQASVWDLPGDSAAKQQATEEFARLEKEKKDQEHHDVEMHAQKQKEEEDRQSQEEMMRHQQEEQRRQQEEQQRRQQEEMVRQEEMRRQQEMERQRQLELQEEEARRRREDEERRRHEEDLRRRQEDDMRRQQEMEQQQREMERQRQRQMEMEREAQRQKEMEMERKHQEEMQRRKVIELEVQRQQEIQRRQELQRQQEMHHQQQEALRQLQQQQLAQIQLPSTAQWGSQTSSGSQQPTNTLSLAQIQMQEEKDRREREEHQRSLEIQRQQIQAFQQQQQQPKTWANSQRMVNNPTPQHAKTLMEIQEEQARQLEKEKLAKQQNKPSVPLATAAAWGGTTNSSNWAQEGAWGQAAKQQGLGFWDEAVKTSASKNKVNSNTPTFPSLNAKPTNNNTANNQMMNKKNAKTQREEENVQRLFQASVPGDDFTQWCEQALRGMQASVDVPTFVTFLLEVDSPYEVHDYVRSYLGETRDANNFAKMFIEKRSKSRNHQRPIEDSMWGPAPAVNPNTNRIGGQTGGDLDKMAAIGAKKNKKKMQKLDSSILGFTVHAAPDRVNVGEIDMCD